MMIDEALICTGALTAWRDQTRRIGLNDFAMALPCVESDMVPLGEFIRATERQAAESRCFTLGWTIGEAEDLRVFGQLGIPVLASSTLGVALKRLAGYFALLQDATELTVRHEDGACIVSYRILDPDIWP